VRHVILVGVLVAAVGLALEAQAPRPAAPAASPVTFAKDVAPIVYANCISCHRAGEVAPMALGSYDEVRPWGALDQAEGAEPADAAVVCGSGARNVQERCAADRSTDRHDREVGGCRRAARQSRR
jgi:hypothetical protein